VDSYVMLDYISGGRFGGRYNSGLGLSLLEVWNSDILCRCC